MVYDRYRMGDDLVQVHFTIPRAWRDELATAAGNQAISFSDLMRLIVRGFLRNRYTLDQREALR